MTVRDISVFRTTGSSHIPIDIGTSSIAGIEWRALDSAGCDRFQGGEVYRSAVLSAGALATLGSDFQRAGALFAPPAFVDDSFTDRYGVGWLVTDGSPAPWDHPLETSEWGAIASHPRPAAPDKWQLPDSSSPLYTVLDAPCPGLIDTCFALRNSWQFMDDLAENWRVAGTLLDWSLEVVAAQYETALAALPATPDIILYADDLGFQSGMYLSNVDFRNFVFPRLKTLVSRIRSLSSAQICFHSCGAIEPMLGEISTLDFEIMNLDFMAKGMTVAGIRKQIAGQTVLHAPFDLVALGSAARLGDRRAIVLLVNDLVQALPAIAAPADMIRTRDDLEDAMRGAAFVRALNDDDLDQLRRFGAVAPILRRATAAARDYDVEQRLACIDGKETAASRGSADHG